MRIDLYCVMGHPVAHSKSPWIHARFAELTGQQLRYEPRLVALDGFAGALREFVKERAGRARGCNVTVPFKFEAAALADTSSERVALAQAANTLSFDQGGIHADNTDGVGLVRDLQHNAGVDLRGRDLLLLGAGGAAAGVLGPLIDAEPARIVVANRTSPKAEVLVARHRALALLRNTELKTQDPSSLSAHFDLIINATASSLGGATLPLPARVLKPGALACDLMYGPAARGFLDWARAHGASARDGLGMLVEQAAEAFLIWRGVRPPSAQVLAELRALIG